MARAWIYPQHHDLVDELVTSSKVTSSATASLRTGPLDHMVEAYLFAVSLALALGGKAQPESEMPTSRKSAREIHEGTLFSRGGDVLGYAVALTHELGTVVSDDDSTTLLREQMDLVAKERVEERVGLLDRYAFFGFEWLRENQPDNASVEELLADAITHTEIASLEPPEIEFDDPLAVLLAKPED